jgi:hypothetical protein
MRREGIRSGRGRCENRSGLAVNAESSTRATIGMQRRLARLHTLGAVGASDEGPRKTTDSFSATVQPTTNLE